MPKQRQELITAALGLADERHQAEAIAGLVNGYQAARVRDFVEGLADTMRKPGG
ncbi:hypothetical protein [Pseudomonas sp. FP1740]|uniref:hypothetical protein n=1 Tax=Pseudomonas sp. FP1740 TaxID=2954078 RepID=UPI00273458F9|nr:hypothetical protein [Pseudomonas sp. FP1740]WLG42739.1 hypothetical protein PSH69_17750 [Pseudomonas sp. FP1740]